MDQLGRWKKGKVAIVTGASRGLGLAFAQRLAAEEAIIVAVDRTATNNFVGSMKDAGATDAAFHQVDVSDEAQVEQMARSVLDRFGRCDIIVNNAGVVPHALLSEITLAEWRRVMAINIDSMFLISRALVPTMTKQNYGRIVNITSSILGEVASGFCHYMASKGAIVGFTRALANEVGPFGVIVNCLAPGLTRTPNTEQAFPNLKIFDMTAQKQAIKEPLVPEDLVGAMSFLTSDDAKFITGQTLIVDGGLIKAI